MSSSLANGWIERIRKKTIKNMTHTEFISKYSGFCQNIDKLVLILCGLRFSIKEYFVIKIHGALYEPFAGPHYVQIGNGEPFWVHSLTAFRREFFGLTDKLSFERSVFICLSDGEVVRLKVARPYLYMSHDVAILAGTRLRIMKNPEDSFYITSRDVERHKAELEDKKIQAASTQQAVRTRVRNHLVSSMQQLFCSYMRDHHIAPEVAFSWFRVDVQFALDQCDILYTNMNRVCSPRFERASEPALPGQAALASVYENSHEVSVLQSFSSTVDSSINSALREHAQQTQATPYYQPEDITSSVVMEGLAEDQYQNMYNTMDFVL